MQNEASPASHPGKDVESNPLELRVEGVDRPKIVISGYLATQCLDQLAPVLGRYGRAGGVQWDLTGIYRIDALAALLCLHHWGGDVPRHLRASSSVTTALDAAKSFLRVPDEASSSATAEQDDDVRRTPAWPGFLAGVWMRLLAAATLQSRIPSGELATGIRRSGADSLVVIILVGFLIGIVASYLGVLQLAQYGAQTLIVEVLGVGVLRELGPVLSTIVIAGRSGSSIAAELGGMRITQEIDALEVLGIDVLNRLVVPRVLALMVAAPLLTAVADVAGLLGGVLAIQQATTVTIAEFVLQLPGKVPLVDLFIGLLKSITFGAAIATVSCFYGLSAAPDTTSLTQATTKAVVTSIVTVLVLDALFAVLLHRVG